MFTCITLAQVVPVGGGQLSVNGEMWISPAAENHPSAIRMHATATDVDSGCLISHYLPDDLLAQLPPGTLSELGRARLAGSMTGPHTGPAVELTYELPPDSRLIVDGSASFTPRSMSACARGPALGFSGTVYISTPGVARLRNADTQVDAKDCMQDICMHWLWHRHLFLVQEGGSEVPGSAHRYRGHCRTYIHGYAHIQAWI